MSNTDIIDIIHSSKRIVIKIGSVLIADEKLGTVRQNWINTVAQDISDLISEGKEVVIVTSGAIALGRKILKIDYTNAPSSISLEKKQAAAAIGNVLLSQAYNEAFQPHGIKIGLALLSPKDTEERESHLNARATLLTMMAHGIIPIINENDTVATSEIRFGDNDRLAARVAQMIEADLLIQLSTTDGLYNADPSKTPDAQHIPVVEIITDDIEALAGDAPKGLSTGGMKSKIMAAKIATQAGTNMMIANGKIDHPLSALKNEAKATIFKASEKPVSARKKWIASHVSAKGHIIIDEGAVKALKTGSSLLPAGVVKVLGNFKHGDPVEIYDNQNHKLAMGLASYSAYEASLIIGHKSSDVGSILSYSRGDELVHRDNLVLSN